ncbi:MAG TPA: DMT family transporter [Thermoanaerobaculia bacterium]|jgi:drug/metabolite transporter (DMT)-like permease
MTADEAPATRRGALLVLAGALLWSTSGIGIKALPDGPLAITFWRSAIAAVALFLLLRPRVARLSPSFLAAVVSYAACLATFVAATKWTTAANAIFLQYSGVLWVLILAPLVLKEPFRPRDAVAIAVAFAGLALFFVGELSAQGKSGNAMALLSGALFATLVLCLRKERDAGAQAAVAWGNVLAAAAILPFALREPLPTPRSFAILAFLGVFQIAAAYTFFVRGLATVPAAQASLIGMAEPVANPVWVFLFLGERPTHWAIAGGIIVIAAVAWRTLSTSAPAPGPPPD